MNKVLASLKTLVTSAAVWHFLNDFGALFLAGAGGLTAYLVIPADGDWKAATGAFVLAALNVAIPAFRRSWAENGAGVAVEARTDAPYIPWFDIQAAADILKDYNLTPAIQAAIEAWITSKLPKVPVQV